MTANGWLQIVFYSLCVLLVAKPLGLYLVRVYDGSMRWLAPVERAIYRVCGVDAAEDQHWTRYAAGVLLFSAVSMLLTYVALRLQRVLPLNPQHLAGVSDRQAFETAASFTTNTNWQSYGGESTMSYFSQMTQLAFHNFVSAAVGMAVAVALVRGIARRSAGTLGNFWVDLVRGTLYVLLPLSLVLALVFVQQGVIQNFKPYVDVVTLEGAKQTLAMGPVASQEAIKQLGTNGGGFFNANAAHPFENPTPWTNFWSMFAIFLIPSALTYMFGRMVEEPAARLGGVGGDVRAVLRRRHDRVLGRSARQSDSRRARHRRHRVGDESGRQHGREGGALRHRQLRAVRDGHDRCVVRRASTRCTTRSRRSAAWCRCVNMQLGEVVFGGVGAGLYGMLVMVVLTVFIAGLMVGRTPEYLGKKIQAREVQMAMLYVLVFPAAILTMTAVSVARAGGTRGAQQRRAARSVGDPLRVHVDRGEQRQRVRRAHRHDLLLQHDARR